MPGAPTMLNRRDQLVLGGVVASVLLLGAAAGARVVAADLREGPLWAVAGALRGINPLAAIACIVLSVVAAVVLLERQPPGDAVSAGFTVASVTAICMIPALFTIDVSVGESDLFAVSAGMVAVPLLIAAVWRRGRNWFLLAASAAAAATIALAASHIDNTERPIPVGISLAILWLPFLLGLTTRFAPEAADRGIRAVVSALHAVGLVFVISAATSCDDDDCIPVPMWFLAGSLATLWFTAAQLLHRRPITDGIVDTDADAAREASTGDPTDQFGAWALAAPLGFLVLAAVVVVPVNPDRDPPTFDAAEPEVITGLPAMLAWEDGRGCVIVAGVDDLLNFREACDAGFVEWVEPGPNIVLEERSRRNSLFDPITFDRSPRSWDFVENPVAPPVALRLDTLSRGRVEVWADEPDGTSRRLLEARGGREYGLDGGGVSPDGTLAAVVDNAGRLLVMPTDGSRRAAVIATNVRRFGAWVPTFGPPIFEFALEPLVPLRIPAGVDVERDFYDAHRELESSLGLSVVADLVVVGDEIHVRLTGTPTADDLPDGYCVAVTSFFESAAASRTYRSVDVGGRVPFCDASTAELSIDCEAPTVPTAATIVDLERFSALVIEAELIAPRSWAPLTASPGYYQLTTGQVTGGATNPDDLPRVDGTCS